MPVTLKEKRVSIAINIKLLSIKDKVIYSIITQKNHSFVLISSG